MENGIGWILSNGRKEYSPQKAGKSVFLGESIYMRSMSTIICLKKEHIVKKDKFAYPEYMCYNLTNEQIRFIKNICGGIRWIRKMSKNLKLKKLREMK